MVKARKSSTSIRIDTELWKTVKIEAIRRDMTISEFVEACLKQEILVDGGRVREK